MSNAIPLEVRCEDFLQDNPHLYAYKARRKKIAIVRVEATTVGSSEHVTVDLWAAKLVVGKKCCSVEPPGRIVRRFSEFTWDFLLYLIVDFHPLLAAVDLLGFLTGPLYNRRLKNQLRLLADGEIVIGPGERKIVLLGFQDVICNSAKLQLSYHRRGGDSHHIECEVES